MSSLLTNETIDSFNLDVQEIFIEITTHFKQQLVKNLPGTKLYTHRDELQLSRRAEVSIYYEGFSQLSEGRQLLEVINVYAKNLCKHFRGCPVKAIDHLFRTNETMIFVASKNKHLDSIFNDYLRIEFDNYPLHDKNSFNVIIRFGDYLNSLSNHSFFRDIARRDKLRLSIDEKFELMQLFAREIKQAISILAKAIRLTHV